MLLLLIFCLIPRTNPVCGAKSDFLTYNNLFVDPVDLNATHFTIMKRSQRIGIRLSLLKIDVETILRARKFFSGQNQKFLMIAYDDTIFRYNTLASTVNKFGAAHSLQKFVLVSKSRSVDFFALETGSKKRGESLSLISETAFVNDVIHWNLSSPIKVQDSLEWNFLTGFRWNEYIYMAFRCRISKAEETELIVLQINATSSKENLLSSIRAFRPVEKSVEYIDLIRSPSGDATLVLESDRKLWSKSMKMYLNELSSAMNCTDDENVISLPKYLASDPQNPPCPKESLLVLNNGLNYCYQLRDDMNRALITVNLNDEVNRDIMVLSSDRKIMICKIKGCSSETLSDCEKSDIGKVAPIDNQVITSLDANRGLVVLIRKGEKNQVIIDQTPILRGDYFPSCPACVMLGFYDNLTWIQGKCVAIEKKPQDIDVCYQKARAVIRRIQPDDIKIVIRLPHKLNLLYGERAFVSVYDDYIEAKYEENTYIAPATKTDLASGEIEIFRPVGGKMRTAFTIVGEEDANPWFDMLLILAALIALVFNVVFVIWYVKKRRNENPTEPSAPSSPPKKAYSPKRKGSDDFL